jgi:hypothetical protein
VFAFLAIVALAATAVWLAARVQAWRNEKPKAHPALNGALGASLLQVMLWVIIATALGVTVLSQHPSVRDAVVVGLMLKLGAAVLVGLCAFIVLLWRWAWLAGDWERRHTEIPRLLIHPLVMYALIVATLASVTTFASLFLFGGSPLHAWLGGLSAYAKWINFGFAALLGLPFLFAGVRNVLHIVIDITSHFFRPALHPFRRELTAGEFVTQQRIEARFRRVLQEVLLLDNVTHITVVAHSQGTMIAIDTLWLKWAKNLLREREVSLVTMGSPFSHLYQYYFPLRYPRLFSGDQAWGGDLIHAVDHWINIYRVDDYIGTWIKGRDGFPVNYRTATPGGHTDYWSDREAHRAMAPFLPASASQTNARAA